jgi:hypothetical protein
MPSRQPPPRSAIKHSLVYQKGFRLSALRRGRRNSRRCRCQVPSLREWLVRRQWGQHAPARHRNLKDEKLFFISLGHDDADFHLEFIRQNTEIFAEPTSLSVTLSRAVRRVWLSSRESSGFCPADVQGQTSDVHIRGCDCIYHHRPPRCLVLQLSLARHTRPLRALTAPLDELCSRLSLLEEEGRPTGMALK